MSAKKVELNDVIAVLSKPSCSRCGKRNGIVFKEMTKTEQQWKESCDVNNIVKRCISSGYNLEQLLKKASELYEDAKMFADVSEFPDIQTAHDMMVNAQESFVQNIPASVRDEYNNNAMEFFKAFVADKDGMIKKLTNKDNLAPLTSEQLEQAEHEKSGD